MAKPSLKDRMAAGVAQKDKFAAADQAMAVGALGAVPPVVEAETDVDDVPKKAKKVKPATNAGFVKGARVTKKEPKGESVIIRETFSMPPDESSAIDAMRVRAAKAGVMLNRSEIVRAGIAALRLLDDETFAEVANDVPKLKTGRPAS